MQQRTFAWTVHVQREFSMEFIDFSLKLKQKLLDICTVTSVPKLKLSKLIFHVSTSNPSFVSF